MQEKWRNDKNVVMVAIGQDGNLLEFVSDELKDDIEVVERSGENLCRCNQSCFRASPKFTLNMKTYSIFFACFCVLGLPFCYFEDFDCRVNQCAFLRIV